MADIDPFELAQVVTQMVQDKLDRLKFIDFAEVKATYQLENGGHTAEVLIPGASTTTNPLNCLLGYIPAVGDWAAVLYPRNTAPVLLDATPMRENTVVPPGEQFAPNNHNHDGVYAPASHNHDDRYYTEQEINSLLADYSLLIHDHDTDYYLKSEVDIFLTDKANKTQEAVVNPSLLSGWVDAGSDYYKPGYFKDTLGIVHFSGAMKNGSLGSGSFQLPVGYRPLKRKVFQVYSNDGTNDVLGSIKVEPTGYVFPLTGSINLISLEGVTFRADQ